MTRISLAASLMAIAVLCVACGGGGGGTSSNQPAVPASSSTGDNSPGQGSQSPGETGGGTGTPVGNQITVSVAANQFGSVDAPIASVTICVAGTTTCQTIPDVLVDTGSFGLRLAASAIPSSFPLARATASAGGTLAECAIFGSGTTWGSVAHVDVHLAGEVAPQLAIQIVGDNAVGAAPSFCTDQGSGDISSAQLMGYNGILGVGLEDQDCGSDCAGSNALGLYYGCATTNAASCLGTTVPLAAQVSNPVANFPADNNGTILQLPSVVAGGAASATGTLTFGIGTQSDNALASNATVYTLTGLNSEQPLTFTTKFKGVSYTDSYIDSGSNGLFFDDTAIASCADMPFWCPTSPFSSTASITGANNAQSTQSFSISNADTMIEQNNDYAMPELGAQLSGAFDWGLPFFFGRSVYTAIDGHAAGGSTGPYYSF